MRLIHQPDGVIIHMDGSDDQIMHSNGEKVRIGPTMLISPTDILIPGRQILALSVGAATRYMMRS